METTAFVKLETEILTQTNVICFLFIRFSGFGMGFWVDEWMDSQDRVKPGSKNCFWQKRCQLLSYTLQTDCWSQKMLSHYSAVSSSLLLLLSSDSSLITWSLMTSSGLRMTSAFSLKVILRLRASSTLLSSTLLT